MIGHSFQSLSNLFNKVICCLYFLLPVTFIILETYFLEYFTCLCSVILSLSILVQK